MPIKPADRARRSVFRHLSLPQRSRLVLGADLNCSESKRRVLHDAARHRLLGAADSHHAMPRAPAAVVG